MLNEPTVLGVTADLADEFNPEQWVNLYQFDPIQGKEHLHYRGRYQIKELPENLIGDSPKSFALEPLDQQGNIISVQQALNDAV